MQEKKELTKLKIIGYTGHLPASMRPGYVAPVFQDNDHIYIAPYELRGDYLVGSYHIDKARFNELVNKRDIIPLLRPLSAWPDHSLWQDVDGTIHYQEENFAKRELRKIYNQAIESAKESLENNNPTFALKEVGIAFCIDPNAETYALTAFCHELKEEHDLVDACFVLAASKYHEKMNNFLAEYRKKYKK